MAMKTVPAGVALALVLPLTGCGVDSTGTAGAAASPSADPLVCETTASSEPCTFGQTAIYTDSNRSGDIKLEITVDAPVEFELSEEAWVPYDLEPNPVNVYFPVTIKNSSPELDLTDVMIHTQATNAEQGAYDGILEVSDREIDGISAFKELAPGESMSGKEGWSMDTLDGVEYELSIDGLAGYSITFTQ